MTTNLRLGPVSSRPRYLAVVDNSLYFIADAYYPGLWRIDDGDHNVHHVADISTLTGNYHSPHATELTNVAGTLYFVGATQDGGLEVWRTPLDVLAPEVVTDLNYT